MQLRASLLLAAVAPMAWAKTIEMGQMGDVPADSKMGNKLLSSARRLGDQDERDQTWIAGYSLRFKSCHSVTTVPQEEGGEELQLYNSNVVVFQLCKTSSCGSQNDKCEGGAEYAINMALFLDAYTEAKMEKEEQICENIRENCYCDNANDEEVCENQCYVNQNADYCVEYEGQEEFEVQRYLECAEMENNERYFIGPYCASSGDAIHLGVFDDIGCVNHSEDGIYMFEKYMYRSLPFSSSDDSIVGNECVQCLQVDEDQNNNNNNNNNGNNNNNNNNGQDAEIIEMCERLYEMSAKCEANLEYSGYSNYWYPDELACNYINNVLPRLDKVFGVKSSVRSSSSSGPAKAFAWIFGITTFALLGVCYWLYTKVQRTSVNLSSQGGTSV